MGQMSKIESRIFTIRGLQVMLDSDISAMYQVEVKRLNEQVRRNIGRFPEEFRFQLSEPEFKDLALRSQIATSNVRGGRRYLPYVFTEQGIAMISAVLHSDIAIKVSIQIMKAFVAMRKILSANTGIIQRLETVEQKQIETDKKVIQLAISNNRSEKLLFEPRQVFDNRQQGSLSFGSKLERFGPEVVCFFKNGFGRIGVAGETAVALSLFFYINPNAPLHSHSVCIAVAAKLQ